MTQIRINSDTGLKSSQDNNGWVLTWRKANELAPSRLEWVLFPWLSGGSKKPKTSKNQKKEGALGEPREVSQNVSITELTGWEDSQRERMCCKQCRVFLLRGRLIWIYVNYSGEVQTENRHTKERHYYLFSFPSTPSPEVSVLVNKQCFAIK